MEEVFISILSRNEPESLVTNELLDCAFHRSHHNGRLLCRGQSSLSPSGPVASFGARSARLAPLDDDLLVQGQPVFLLGQGIRGTQLREQGVQELAEAGPGLAEGKGALVLNGSVDQRNQERHLGRRQSLRLPAEVGTGGGPKAEETRAPLNDVQVDLEDAVLAEGRLQQQRERQLLELPPEALLGRQEQVLGELLRDRRSAARGAAPGPVGQKRRGHLSKVDAGMGVEAGILAQKERAQKERRHRGERDEVG